MNTRLLVFACLLLLSLAAPAFALDLIYNFPLSFYPWWTTQGDWQFGQPTGAGSQNHDPLGGHTGLKVYGCNLTGDYTWWQGAQYLTTPPLDCSALTNTTLSFYRWLGVCRFDRVSIQASSDNLNWTTIWQNPVDVDISDDSWVLCHYDISSLADGQPEVWIRWAMGPTEDNSFPGWNIDDIQILADTTDLPLQILAWIPYADLTFDYPNTLDALDTYFDYFIDYVVTESTAANAATLANELVGKQVFLVPSPAEATDSQLAYYGNEFSTVLQDFVQAGGTVIVAGESDLHTGFLDATGLMTVICINSYTGGPVLSVVEPFHPLADGVGSALVAQETTSSYYVGPEATPIVEDTLGDAVVACRDLGYGAVILLGYDYFAYDDDAACLLANSVLYPRATFQILLYDDLNLRHAAQEALSRLGYFYTVAGHDDFDPWLTSQPWDLVVADCPSVKPASGWGELVNYIHDDGSAALSTWGLAVQDATDPTDETALCAACGVSAGESLTTIPPVYRWPAPSGFFTKPQQVPDLTNWRSELLWKADRLSLADEGPAALAGFTPTPTQDQAALVLGSGGRTLINGFLWELGDQDANANGISDCVELIMNEVQFLLRNPHPDFTASPNPCTVGDQVNFTSSFSFDTTAWVWDFGDAQGSAQQHPSHTYTGPGLYTATLTAANPWTSLSAARRIAVSFPDVGPRNWALYCVLACVTADIVTGYEDGAYGPALPVSRDQMAVFISRAKGWVAVGDDMTAAPELFPDVPAGFWCGTAIQACLDNNIVTGYEDAHYRPEETVTRDQMAVFISRAKGWVAIDGDMTTAPALFPDVPAGFWSGTAIQACLDNDVVSGYLDGSYHPDWTVTRDQMAVYIARAFDLLP